MKKFIYFWCQIWCYEKGKGTSYGLSQMRSSKSRFGSDLHKLLLQIQLRSCSRWSRESILLHFFTSQEEVGISRSNYYIYSFYCNVCTFCTIIIAL